MNIERFEYLCDKAYKLAEEDKYTEALAICDDILGLSGGEVMSYRERAAILNRMGSHSEALIAINTAIELGSNEPSDYFDKSRLCFRLGEYEESIKSANTALQISERESDEYYTSALLFMRAECLRRVDNYDATIEDCDRLGDDYVFFLPGVEEKKSVKQIRDEAIAARDRMKKKSWKFE